MGHFGPSNDESFGLDITMRIIGAFFLHTRLDSHKRIRSIIPSCGVISSKITWITDIFRSSSTCMDLQWAILMSIPMSYIAAIAWVTFDEQSKPLRSNETDAGTGFTKSQTEGHPNQDPSLGERTMAATEIINSFVTLAVTVEASPSKWHELFLSKPKMIWLIEHVAAELEVPVFLLRRSEEVGIVRRATVQSSESARKGMGWEGVAFWFFTQMLANGTD